MRALHLHLHRGTGSLVALTLLLACGGGSESASSGTPQNAPTAPSAAAGCASPSAVPSCDASIDVATAEDLYALVESLAVATDVSPRPDSGAKLLPSPDVRATAPIVIDAAVLRQRKPACADRADAGAFSGRCLDWELSPEKPTQITEGHVNTIYPPGVTCIAPTSVGFGACESVKIEPGTVVRFQRVHERSPVQLTDWYYVRVVRSCATACAASETWCASSKTCITSGPSFCLLCAGGPPDECACRDACNAPADGVACEYDFSDDQLRTGTCRSGRCQ